MEASPTPALVVIETQVALAALKVLLDVPPRTTQAQTGRRLRLTLKELGQITVIRRGVCFGPIDNQPRFFDFPSCMTQAVSEKNTHPCKPGPAGASIGRLPLRGMPQIGTDLQGDGQQVFWSGLFRGGMAALLFKDQTRLPGPSLMGSWTYL